MIFVMNGYENAPNCHCNKSSVIKDQLTLKVGALLCVPELYYEKLGGGKEAFLLYLKRKYSLDGHKLEYVMWKFCIDARGSKISSHSTVET